MDVCIESASDLKPTKSLAAQLQFWGRVLRYKTYNAIINDHVNNYKEHHLPCTDREWSLQGRKKKKKGEVEPVSPTRQCPECFCAHKPAPHCPQCGYVYPVFGREIEEVDGELHKMDKKALQIKQKQEVYAAQTLDELIQLAKSRGYKNPVGWAGHIVEARAAKERAKQNGT